MDQSPLGNVLGWSDKASYTTRRTREPPASTNGEPATAGSRPTGWCGGPAAGQTNTGTKGERGGARSRAGT
ncbi:unnamed protein product [Boreogadus saida]